jgi:hypothetical protein
MPSYEKLKCDPRLPWHFNHETCLNLLEHNSISKQHYRYNRTMTIMFQEKTLFLSAAFLLLVQQGYCWNSKSFLSRREAIATATASLVAVPSLSVLADDDTPAYEFRSRKSNKGGVVREDYYYMMGKSPPRLLSGPISLDDPQWNAFGTCETTGAGSATNSCTYVSLKQRIPAYSKYAFNIRLGAKEYRLLGKELNRAAATNSESAWDTAASYLTTLPQSPPPPPVDALLKMVLFASSMLTSPNYSGISRELLVARFYVNEVSFATKEIAAAIDARDSKRALAAWDFGKDSWNSYFQIVNGRISPKVGDEFELLA